MVASQTSLGGLHSQGTRRRKFAISKALIPNSQILRKLLVDFLLAGSEALIPLLFLLEPFLYRSLFWDTDEFTSHRAPR